MHADAIRAKTTTKPRPEQVIRAYHEGWLDGAIDALHETCQDDDDVVRTLCSIGADEDEVTAELKKREEDAGGES